jgi:hypothetical protein
MKILNRPVEVWIASLLLFLIAAIAFIPDGRVNMYLPRGIFGIFLIVFGSLILWKLD